MSKIKEVTDTKVSDNGILEQPTLKEELDTIVKQHNDAVQKKEQYSNLIQKCLVDIEVLERMIKNAEVREDK